MKIHKSHLLKYFDQKLSEKDLSDALFKLGHEHEIENDLFEFEITPNRGDCLSLKGIVRDLQSVYKANFELETFDQKIESFDFNFRNEAPSKCPKITFLKLDIEALPNEYSGDLKSYFQLLDLKKNNFFTDVSNYVAYEIGQPSHCYEFGSIYNELELKILKNDENFRSLFNTNHKISSGDLVFTSNNKIVNLAGIMGGEYSACDKETKKVIVEFAFFIPESISGRAVKYNLISDASHKFERGIDYNLQETAMRRFIKIVSEHCKINEVKVFSQEAQKFTNKTIPFDPQKINSILGTNLEDSVITGVLRSLDFELSNYLKVPSYRNDIENTNDLAEEIARVVGYDNLPRKNYHFDSKVDFSETKEVEKKLKYFFVKNGFNEVINESFVSSKSDGAIKIDNPIDTNRTFFRTDLKQSLVNNLEFNERRQKEIVKLFEISEVYLDGAEQNPLKKIGLIISGRRGKNPIDFSKKLDENYLKDIFEEVGFEILKFSEEIDRSNVNSKSKAKVHYAEFLITDIKDNLENFNHNFDKFKFNKYRGVSDFPSSNRDFSFLVDSFDKKSKIEKKLMEHDSKDLREFYNFDIFENAKTGEIKLGYRLVFQSFSETLNDQIIDEEVKEILKPILSIRGIKIPGLN